MSSAVTLGQLKYGCRLYGQLTSYDESPMAGFATLLGLEVVQPPTTGDQILSPLTPDRVVRRRGRANGLTAVRFPNPPLPDASGADGELLGAVVPGQVD